MAINLKKGDQVLLDASMRRILVGLGWSTDNKDIDLDASLFMLGENGLLLRDEDFVFYHNLNGRDGAVVHTGDSLTGGSDEDDEVIYIDFTKMPDEIKKITICVTIYNAENRRQNFGQVSNAYIRIAGLANQLDVTGKTVLRYDLKEEFSIETALIVAEIYRKDKEWRFNAIGSGYQGGLAEICRSFGADVE